jgi:hypothetical protein
MALEMRGSNGPYYYKKVRDGDTVRSVYQGGSELALLEHRLDESRRVDEISERANQQAAFRAEIATIVEIERSLNAVAEHVEAMATAVFLVHGYHKHSRSWRRRANG